MAIEVELPGGTIAEFPDGTSKETIEQALSAHFSGAPSPDGEPGPPVGRAGAASLGAIQGATGGFGDELYGAFAQAMPKWLAPYLTPTTARLSPEANERAAAAGLPTNYEVARDLSRDINTGAQEAHPWSYLAGEFAGGVGATGGAVGAAPSFARLAATGAPLGALYGAGYSEADTPGGVAADTAVGAAVGGVAAPAAGAALSRLLRGVGSGAAAARDRFMATPKREARVALQQALGEDAVTPQAGQSLLQETAGEGRLLDLGPNTTGLAEAIAQRPGRGQSILREALESRQQGQQGRMIGLIEDTVQPAGWTDDYRQLMNTLVTNRRTQAGPLYRAAYQRPIQSTPEMTKIIGEVSDARHPLHSAWKKAGQTFRMEQGEGGDVRFLDLLGREIGDLESAALRKGRNNAARNYGNWRRGLNEEIYKQVPELEQARGVFAGAKQLEDAADAGRSVLQGTKTTADDVIDATANFSDSQWDAYRIGAVRGMVDRVKQAPDTHNAANKLGRSTRVKEILDVLFENDQAAEEFFSRMSGEQIMSFSQQQILGNSRTVARQMQNQRLDQNPMLNAGVDLMTGDKVGAAVNTLRAMAGRSEISDEALEELAEMLLAKPDSGHLSRLLRGTSAPGQQARSQSQQRRLRNVMSGGLISPLAEGQAD